MTELMDFAALLAQRSGELIKPLFFDLGLTVENKSDGSPVTKADRDAEALMRELIRARYPDHGVIGEEYGRDNPDAEFVWVLDPIDGTVSFTHKCPLFGTMIGLLCQGKPILGAIHQPVMGQLCLSDGQKTTLNGATVKMREQTELSAATLLATDIANISRFQDGTRFENLRQQTKLFRTWGDCYGYLLLASGFADIMMDPIMHIWDIVPLIPIIEGAGGVITAWDGSDPLSGTSIVASNKHLHAQIVGLLA